MGRVWVGSCRGSGVVPMYVYYGSARLQIKIQATDTAHMVFEKNMINILTI